MKKIQNKIKTCKKKEELAKVYKHLNKRLEYIITPKKLIEKEKNDAELIQSFNQYKGSKEMQQSLHEHILQKTLAFLEKTVYICNNIK